LQLQRLLVSRQQQTLLLLLKQRRLLLQRLQRQMQALLLWIQTSKQRLAAFQLQLVLLSCGFSVLLEAQLCVFLYRFVCVVLLEWCVPAVVHALLRACSASCLLLCLRWFLSFCDISCGLDHALFQLVKLAGNMHAVLA
jgi:hypothetical protein